MSGLITAYEVLRIIESHGFRAFLVGGAVRDIVMGKIPSDYDIATSASPYKIKEIFSSFKQYLSGERYKTVGVIFKGTNFEITTFREESGYGDHRHPDVTSASNINSDVLRRDFTINAIYMDKNGEIFDPLLGKEDIKKRLIRAVGNADERFSEDALRILRAVRFASALCFKIESETALAMRRCAPLIKNISKERITEELKKAVAGEAFFEVLSNFSDVFFTATGDLPLFSDKEKAAFKLLTADEKFYFFLSKLTTGLNRLALSSRQKKTAAFLHKYLNAETIRLSQLFYEDEFSANVFLKIKKACGEEIILPDYFIYKIKDLAVNGNDLDINPKLKGKALKEALFAVADGRLLNDREKILEFIRLLYIDK